MRKPPTFVQTLRRREPQTYAAADRWMLGFAVIWVAACALTIVWYVLNYSA